MRPRTPIAITALLVAAFALTACGGSGDEGASASPSISLPASAMASSSASEPIGADPGTWSPILIKKKMKSITLVPGQIAVFPTLEYAKNPNFVAVVSDAAVVEVLDPNNDAVLALRAVAPGTATVKVYQGNDQGGQGKYLRKVKVTVTEP